MTRKAYLVVLEHVVPCANAELDSFCSPFGVGVGLPGIWQIKTRKALESSNQTQSDVCVGLIFDVTGLRGVVTGLETSKHSPGTTVCVVDSLTDGLEHWLSLFRPVFLRWLLALRLSRLMRCSTWSKFTHTYGMWVETWRSASFSSRTQRTTTPTTERVFHHPRFMLRAERPLDYRRRWRCGHRGSSHVVCHAEWFQRSAQV